MDQSNILQQIIKHSSTPIPVRTRTSTGTGTGVRTRYRHNHVTNGIINDLQSRLRIRTVPGSLL